MLVSAVLKIHVGVGADLGTRVDVGAYLGTCVAAVFGRGRGLVCCPRNHRRCLQSRHGCRRSPRKCCGHLHCSRNWRQDQHCPYLPGRNCICQTACTCSPPVEAEATPEEEKVSPVRPAGAIPVEVGAPP